jgi:thiosulfate dehydrogenase
MPLGAGRSLTQQEALDVAAYLHLQGRPVDPRDGRLRKLAERFVHWLGGLTGRR